MSTATVSPPSAKSQPRKTATPQNSINIDFGVVWLFAITTFVSAFLLFQVQPLISKYILPWFGGSPAVWTTCMLFFQTVLFAGYAYAYLTTVRLNITKQVALHCLLLIAAVYVLPIAPDASWKPSGDEDPVGRILMLLVASVGLPYFVISATGPLLQNWFSHRVPGTSPYRLYALSNIGSLLALLSYPFVVEPALSCDAQAVWWSRIFQLFAVLCGACAINLWLKRHQPSATEDTTATNRLENETKPTLADHCRWFGYAMTPSLMLLATTNRVCLDVATIPFLWIAPLTLYLLSFILCFDSDRWYSRKGYAVALGIGILLTVVTMSGITEFPIILQVAIAFGMLFAACMLCHGELVALKPSANYLTSFYLFISAGGAAGGLFVGLFAPLVFPDYWEFPIGLLVCCAILFRQMQSLSTSASARPSIHEASATSNQSKPTRTVRPIRKYGMLAALVVLLSILPSMAKQASESLGNNLTTARNFYGVLRVNDRFANHPTMKQRFMAHGSTVHGLQFLAEERRDWPTTYYTKDSGIGRVLSALKDDDTSNHVGVVGLGVGTLATYGRSQDRYCFYEINQLVRPLAEKYFSFLTDPQPSIEHVLGDARLSMEFEAPRAFDVLVLDAFSSDAIPTHLLTKNAAEIYARHLKQDSILAVHISNRHFDLRPVVVGLAQEIANLRNTKTDCRVLIAPLDESIAQTASVWMICGPPERMAELPLSTDGDQLSDEAKLSDLKPIVWTDDHVDMLRVLR